MNGTTVTSDDNVFSNGIDVENVQENSSVLDGTFGLAPGAERSQHSSVSSAANGIVAPTHINNVNGNNDAPAFSGLKSHIGQEVKSGKVVMDYSTDFPKLPDAPNVSAAAATSVWGRRPVIKSTEITEAFKLTAAERSSRGLGKFGSASEEQHICNAVAVSTGTKIELCEAKDQSLTILITGKCKDVEVAQARLARELQAQANVQISIPKQYHGHIIGKEGSKLRSLENDYLCKIFIPAREGNSDIIRIAGPAEYIGNAARKIAEIGEELARLGNESLQIPREFYPWIHGPANETLERITKSAPSVKVNFPPISSNSNIIFVTGEKKEVDYVVFEICNIYNKKKATNKTLTCKVSKAQHRFIIGPKRSGIDEILRETDVLVEVPAEDNESDSITLRGPPERLGDALALVYSKASSVISQEIHYPEWMRRFLIGPKGATLQQLVPNQEKLKLEFEDGGVIYLEGTPESVKAAYVALSAEVARLNKVLSFEVIKASPALHGYIIGRNGVQVNKLKEEHDVQITMPNENSKPDEIRVEGKKEGVKKAVATIKEIIAKLENEKSCEIVIEQRFHGQIIGKNGEAVQKWRNQYPSVSIIFPDANNKSNIVILRGDHKEVDELYKAMSKMAKDFDELYYQETVSIFKEYYKHIIGKNGSNINRIREETQTRIELPVQGDGRVVVVGKRANVEKAIQLLNKIQNELESIITSEVSIPNRIHTRLLSNGRRLIHDIEDEFGGVQILFPKEKSSDKITVRGPKEDVAKAVKALKDTALHLEATTEELTIPTKPEYIKFLIGRQGINVKKMRENYPSVRIIFPTESDTEPLNILLLGKKEEVVAVKENYEKQIAELSEHIEITTNVDPKYHRHFTVRSAEVLREIQNNNGGCQISFPKQETGDSKVIIKGSKSCVESAKVKIEEIVSDLEAQVTINVDIPEIHHRSLMSYLNDIRKKYNVRIKIPDRGTKNEDGEYIDGIGPADLIQITGRDTKCELAKAELISLIPVTKTISVPIDYHPLLIGRGGDAVRQLMNIHGVRVKFPTLEEKSEEIAISGINKNVNLAIADINKRVAEWNSQFCQEVSLDVRFHPRLIGQRHRNLKKIEDEFAVEIRIPLRNGPNPDVVVVAGKSEDAVYDCINHLRTLEEDFIDELIDRGIYHPHRAEESHDDEAKRIQQFEITGAPWQLDNVEQFPAMEASSASNQSSVNQAPVTAGVWSQRRW